MSLAIEHCNLAAVRRSCAVDAIDLKVERGTFYGFRAERRRQPCDQMLTACSPQHPAAFASWEDV
jgi:hypothetical protein